MRAEMLGVLRAVCYSKLFILSCLGESQTHNICPLLVFSFPIHVFPLHSSQKSWTCQKLLFQASLLDYSPPPVSPLLSYNVNVKSLFSSGQNSSKEKKDNSSIQVLSGGGGGVKAGGGQSGFHQPVVRLQLSRKKGHDNRFQ